MAHHPAENSSGGWSRSPPLPQDGIHNPPAGLTVSIGIDRLGHGAVGGRVGQQTGGMAVNHVFLRPRQQHRSRRHGLRALGLPAQHQNGPAQGGGLLLPVRPESVITKADRAMTLCISSGVRGSIKWILVVAGRWARAASCTTGDRCTG